MSNVGNIRQIFHDIAVSIREKTGSSNQITPMQMPNAINNINGSREAVTDWFAELTNDANPASCVNMFRDSEYWQPVYISPLVTNCSYMLYNANFHNGDLYFVGPNHSVNVRNMIGAKRGAIGVSIYCENASYLTKTGSDSVVGEAITWDINRESNRNCYYNNTYNVRIYDNWRGS